MAKEKATNKNIFRHGCKNGSLKIERFNRKPQYYGNLLNLTASDKLLTVFYIPIMAM